MSAVWDGVSLRRRLAAVYRFYDAFLFPLTDSTPPITLPLEVSIPALGWQAFRAETDATYRFSTLTLTQAAPSGNDLVVEVRAPHGEYLSSQPILLDLPRPLSDPPKRTDLLITQPLWPTPAFRLPAGETAVRGHVVSPTALPVAGLDVEIWPGSAAAPRGQTPLTRTDDRGDFLYRLPYLKGVRGKPTPLRIRLSGGAIGVTPSSLSIAVGDAQVLRFQRM